MGKSISIYKVPCFFKNKGLSVFIIGFMLKFKGNHL